MSYNTNRPNTPYTSPNTSLSTPTAPAQSTPLSPTSSPDPLQPPQSNGYVIPRTQKAPSKFLHFWLNSDELHGYEFDENVLFGYEPDTEWLGGYINQPNNWDEVVKCLRSEINGQRRLAHSSTFRSHVDVWYWRGCIGALKEVRQYYLQDGNR